MRRALFAVAIVIGCRGDPHRAPAHDQVGGLGGLGRLEAGGRSVVPTLPRSTDAAQELGALDLEIERARTTPDPAVLIASLARRAAIRGQLEDFTDAMDQSLEWTKRAPTDPNAWRSRIAVLLQTHRFADASTALATLTPLTKDPSEWEPLSATLHEATGDPEGAAAYREHATTILPSAVNLTALAANLAARGKLADAIALIPRAAAAIDNPSPVLVSWLLVQWGQLYVAKGEPAAARQLFEEAHSRMPAYVEATAQLASAIRATGGDPAPVATPALADGEHPELLALAGKLDEAEAQWDRYTHALREAFADHAARFYLATGRSPTKLVALAEDNFANRPTPEARALLVEARLATATWGLACSDARPLVASTRAHRFLAWRAFTACGKTADADRVAMTLGIQ